MTSTRVSAIVEGHGECEAVPILIRRVALEIDPTFAPQVLPPLRVHASRLVKQGELERAVEFAARKLQGRGGILVLLDCDVLGCCPARTGPELLARARAARSDVIVSVVLAKREFEAWLLAAAESLSGKRGLPNSLAGPTDPESIRDAKGWLSERKPQGYAETADQPALTAVFDMQAARRADSFDKCYREIESMLRQLRGTESA